MSPTDDPQASSAPTADTTKRPGKRADTPGAWATAGAIGAIFLLFFTQVRTLPDDIQRWPTWLLIAGGVLLALYALQQVALSREWKVVDKLDDLETLDEDDPTSQRAQVDAIAKAREKEALETASKGAEDAERAGRDDALSYGNAEDYTRRGDLKTFAAAVAFFAFALVGYGFGYLIAALIFIPVYMFIAGARSPVKLIGVTLGSGIAVYLLFGYILNAPLTRGEWFRTDWLTAWIPL